MSDIGIGIESPSILISRLPAIGDVVMASPLPGAIRHLPDQVEHHAFHAALAREGDEDRQVRRSRPIGTSFNQGR
jgi:hypothetical protein